MELQSYCDTLLLAHKLSGLKLACISFAFDCNSDMFGYIAPLMFELLRHCWFCKRYVMTSPTPVGRGEDAVQPQFLSCIV